MIFCKISQASQDSMVKPKTIVKSVNPREHIWYLTKLINRITVIIDKSETIGNIKKIDKKIEFTMLRTNRLTEIICFFLVDNKNERENAKQFCSEHTKRDSKVLEEWHLCFQNHFSNSTTVEETMPQLTNSAFENKTLLQSLRSSNSILFQQYESFKSNLAQEAPTKLKNLL